MLSESKRQGLANDQDWTDSSGVGFRSRPRFRDRDTFDGGRTLDPSPSLWYDQDSTSNDIAQLLAKLEEEHER